MISTSVDFSRLKSKQLVKIEKKFVFGKASTARNGFMN
jgi:hypothetical protein